MEERWIVNGIRGRGDLPPMAGNWKGPVIILGCGRCLYDDLVRYPNPDVDVMAVNWAGFLYPMDKRHFVTLHGEELPHYLALNRIHYKQRGHIFTHALDNAEVVWDFDEPEIGNGTSSLFAVLIALVLGYNPVILAGVPLDNSGNFYHPLEYKVNAWEKSGTHDKWLEYRPLFMNRVFSLSGFTREILGEPPGC